MSPDAGGGMAAHYGRPTDIYQKSIIDLAGKVSGRSIDKYDDAVATVAGHARERADLSSSSDLIDLMESFDGIEGRHAGVEGATIATVLLLGQPLVVTNRTGAGVEAVMRAAAEENMEIAIVKAPKSGQTPSEVRSAIRKLALQASRIPSPSTGGIVVLVTGLAKAAQEFKSELIAAITNRRVGPFPVPAGVHVVLAETGVFSVEDYPSEVLMQAVSLSIKGQEETAVDEVTQASDTRRKILERALKAAEDSGDPKRIQKIRERLGMPGYVGAYDLAPKLSAKGREKIAEEQRERRAEGDPVAEKLADVGFAHTSSASRAARAVVITEVVQPERSELRRDVSRRLLVGIGGREFAENALSNYMRKNGLGTETMPSVEEIVSGTTSNDDIRRALDKGGKAYAASLASELRESPMVDEVMRGNGSGAARLAEAFLAILDFESEIGRELAKDRPLLVYT